MALPYLAHLYLCRVEFAWGAGFNQALTWAHFKSVKLFELQS